MKRKIEILPQMKAFLRYIALAMEQEKDRTEREETVQWTVLANGPGGAWGENIILQPIEESLNEFNDKMDDFSPKRRNCKVSRLKISISK